MRIGILGANFKTTNINLREKIDHACQKFFPQISWQRDKGYILLSTCNRCEIYFSGENLAEIHEVLLNLFRKEIQDEFEPFLYSYFGADAFFHLAKVTSGLDSAILGESEIQGQVKRAYLHYSKKFTLPSSLHFIFQKSLKIGKNIRSHSILFPKTPSLCNEIDRLASILLPKLSPSLFFLGNSKINQNLILFFQKKGIKQIALCSRHPISEKYLYNAQIKHIPWHRKDQWMQYDMVIAAARNANFVIEEPLTGNIQTKILFDLGVPRNIQASLEKNPFLHFFNLEHLEKFFEKNNQRYGNNIQLCEAEIKNTIIKYYTSFKLKQQKFAPQASNYLY
ncbi:MAG: glutamyl-tRNA reductase [Simkaniaceae bacterium]